MLSPIMGVAPAPGFNEWVAVGDEGEDPFAEFKEIQFANIKALSRAGLFLSCREGKGELEVKAVSSFKFADISQSYTYKMSFAVDGEVLFKDTEAILSFNSFGKAIDYIILKGDDAQNVAQKFGEARKFIAICDGIKAGTEIYSAYGISAIGKKQLQCLLK